jgi:ABC-type sugar transport system ATPase subunit
VNAGTLSVANQQMIEILRAVQTDQNVLIMDEPTAPTCSSWTSRRRRWVALSARDYTT